MAATVLETADLRDGILAASAAGRLKIASSFFDSSTVTAKFAANAIADGILTESYIKANGTRAFGADQSMGGFKLTNLATPVSATDAATMAYVDSVAQGLDVKTSVRFATTANLVATRSSNILTATSNGTFAAVDGITPVVGNRVLVKDQTTAADNGIYTVTSVGSGGTPWVMTRATDADTSAEVTAGMFTFISEGTVNGDSGWVLTTDDAITLNTTSLAFGQFSGAGTFTAGAGLTKTDRKSVV